MSDKEDILEQIRARSADKTAPAKKAPAKKAAPKKTTTPKADPAPHDIHLALAIERRGKYYFVVEYHIANGIVVDEVLSEELMRSEALNQFKIKAARMFMDVKVVKASDA